VWVRPPGGAWHGVEPAGSALAAPTPGRPQ
jgi:hypothetical protein